MEYRFYLRDRSLITGMGCYKTVRSGGGGGASQVYNNKKGEEMC